MTSVTLAHAPVGHAGVASGTLNTARQLGGAVSVAVLGSMLGVFVLRIAGLATALRARESLNRGELPTQTMLEGLMLALAGGLLILPGFVTDVLVSDNFKSNHLAGVIGATR